MPSPLKAVIVPIRKPSSAKSEVSIEFFNADGSPATIGGPGGSTVSGINDVPGLTAALSGKVDDAEFTAISEALEGKADKGAASGSAIAFGIWTVGSAAGSDFLTTGTNDHVKIQQAVDAVIANGTKGGVVRLLPQVYDIRSTITVPKNPKIKITGAYTTKTGFGGTTLKVNSASANLPAIISETGTSPAVTSNADLSHASQYDQLVFDGNDKADVGLLLLNTDHTIVSACKFVGTLIGIDGQYNGTVAQSDYAGGLRVDASSFAATNINMRLDSHTQDWITDSWFLGVNGAVTHVALKSCNKLHFSNNEFNSVGSEIFKMEDTTALYCGDINVTGGFMNAGSGKLFWNDLRTNANSKGFIVAGVRMVAGIKTRLFQQAREFQGITYSASATLDWNDQVVLLNASSAAVTLALPAVATAVQSIWIKATSVTNAAVLTPNGSDTIEGAATFTFAEANESILLVPDSNRWRILNNYKPSGGSGGGTAETVVEISSATYTLGTTTDVLLVNASAAAVTVTLPSKATKATATRKSFTIKVINAAFPVTIVAAGSDQIDNSGQTSVVINDTRAVTFVGNTGSRWRTYTSYDTSVQQRFHDGVSGRMFMTKSAVVAVAQTFIPDGSGDVTKVIYGRLIVNDGTATSVAQNFTISPGGTSVDVVIGTSTWTFAVSAAGAFTVIRSAGTASGTVTVDAIWQ